MILFIILCMVVIYKRKRNKRSDKTRATSKFSAFQSVRNIRAVNMKSFDKDINIPLSFEELSSGTNMGIDSHHQKMVFNCDRIPLRNPPASLGRILLYDFTYRQYQQDFISPKKNSLVPGRIILQTIWYSQKAPEKLVCKTN